MAYRQNDPLIAGNPATDYVFRVVRDCWRFKPKNKKSLVTLAKQDLNGPHVSLSGFWCEDWPLGVAHPCIPDALQVRDAVLAFNRIVATELNINCVSDGIGFENHVDIQLPKYYDADGCTSEQFEHARHRLLELLVTLWTNCEPTVECN